MGAAFRSHAGPLRQVCDDISSRRLSGEGVLRGSEVLLLCVDPWCAAKYLLCTCQQSTHVRLTAFSKPQLVYNDATPPKPEASWTEIHKNLIS